MRELALIFSGQGTQYIGMGKKLYTEFKEAYDVFEEASYVLGKDLSKLCFEGSSEELIKTYNAQPVILTLSYAMFKVYMKEIGIEPKLSAGHSLGELTALTCAGAFEFKNAVELAMNRGLFMDRMATQVNGGMIAVRGVDRSIIEEEYKRYRDNNRYLAIANYNSPKQIVISGEVDTLNQFKKQLENIGAKVTKLNVSGAFHSLFMHDAAYQFKQEVEKYQIKPLRWPVISNVTALPYEDTACSSELLSRQIVSPVHWQESIEYILSKNIRTFIELGPKSILKNLMHDYEENITGFSYDRYEDRCNASKILLGEPTKIELEKAQTKIVTLLGNEDGKYTKTENELANIYGEVLGIEEVNIYESFYELGGDSISLMKIIARLKSKYGYTISNSQFIDAGTIFNISNVILQSTEDNYNSDIMEYTVVKGSEDELNKPFPITEVQKAYLVGRNTQFVLGGVGTHIYLEFITQLDIGRLNKSLIEIINRHPIMRSIILPEAQQKVLEEVPEYVISYIDISNLSQEEQQIYIKNKREKLSHRVFETDKWPLFGFEAYKISEWENYLFVDVDMLIADGGSLQIIGNELIQYYNKPDEKLPELMFTFKDYMMGYQEIRKSQLYKEDKRYWLDKLEEFPAAPQLPLRVAVEDIKKPHFKRYCKVINSLTWKEIKKKIQNKSISPSAVLCTAYIEVLAYWSNQQDLAINMTVFNRYEFNQDVEKIIGDFTSTVLLGAHLNCNDSFWEKAERIQNVILEALEHRHYDGIEFSKELSKNAISERKVIMPIVFTSMLNGDKSQGGLMDLGKLTFSVSQTPQVFIDCQVVEVKDTLMISWDYVDELFEEYMISNMFEQYISSILGIMTNSTEEKLQPPAEDLQLINEYNNTDKEIEVKTLHELFIKKSREFPGNIAIEMKNEKITYKELDLKSNAIAQHLEEKGIQHGEFVGVIAKRCPETIMNILGILKVGAAYVPIDPEYPEERKDYIINNSKCRYVLEPDFRIQNNINKNVENYNYHNDINAIAYVIYTSGSTGKPKGVVITHREAANTILDINDKYSVNESDRILGIASMCFDLSVYDIFGALSAGGTLVMIPDQRNIKNLMDAIYNKKITIWNSVPAIMNMLVDNLEEEQDESYYWSPVVHWNMDGANVIIRGKKYSTDISEMFPKFYCVTQKGCNLYSITKIFKDIDKNKIAEFMKELIEDQILVKGILTPKEIFSTQEKLFRNTYGEDIAFDAEKVKRFKALQLNRRNIDSKEAKLILKSEENYPGYIVNRRSCRKFREDREIKFEEFSRMLSVLKQNRTIEEVKYYYASGGGLYPIDIYVYIKENRIEGCGKGLYYYCPIDNSLNLINAEAHIDEGSHYFTNKDIFNSSAFSIYFIYNAEANMPKYGTNGYLYACIDTGIIVATINAMAEDVGIGLCSIGDMVFNRIEKYFKLNENQVLIHTIEGGLKIER